MIGLAVRWIENGAHRGGRVIAKIDDLYMIQDTFKLHQFYTLERVKFRVTLPRDLQGSIDSLVFGQCDVTVHFTDKRDGIVQYGTPIYDEIMLEFEFQCVLTGSQRSFQETPALLEAHRQHLEFEKAVKDAFET